MTGIALKPCGTHAAYQRHLNNGEKPDDACREANRVYRAASGINARTLATKRAKVTLACYHRDEYDALLGSDANVGTARDRAMTALSLMFPEHYHDLLAAELSRGGAA
jgi:hypothetical protein